MCSSNSFNLSVSSWQVAPGGDNCANAPADGTGEYIFDIELVATANQRYDVGVYLNTVGGSAHTDAGATSCYSDSLTPSNSTGACDADGDGNACLDVDSGACGTDTATITTGTISVSCTLFDPNTGDITFDTCVAWDNNQNGSCAGPPVPADPTSQCDCASLTADGDVALPVEISHFAINNSAANELSFEWATSSETDNAGFEVQLASSEQAFETIEWIQGHGTSLEAHNYEYRVADLKPGKYSARIKQIDFDGTVEFSQVIETSVDIPEDYYLGELYPNPFNPEARVEFGVPESVEVTLALYDLSGRLVRTLYSGQPEANSLVSTRIDGEGLPSGIYLVQLEGPTFRAVKKATLIK